MFWKEVRAMAQRGRKPKPTAVKVLEGNPGKRSLNTNEPKPVKKAPRCLRGWKMRQRRNGSGWQNRWSSWVF